MISSYQEALKYLYENLPMFQRVGPAAIRQDLTNTIKLCKALGDPHLRFPSVHVAGTNGKGSSCHMLSSVLQTAGYTTGLYTSPHLKEFTERIKVNGKEVSGSYVTDFVNRIQPLIEQIRPSFFEITVAMAFDYFARLQVDVAVIEVGLGGRLDSTNVITPLVSLITNISWDHKDLLGNTLERIAGEKAGIIKAGVPAVVSERQREVESVFLAKAAAEGSELFFASDEYAVSANSDVVTVRNRRGGGVSLEKIRMPLVGHYQRRNLPGVLKTVDVLRRFFDITDDHLRAGLEQTIRNTGLKGRWHILYSNPIVVCDTAHNEAGIQEVLRQVSQQRFEKLIFVLGFVRDKDIKSILTLFPVNAVYYFCQAKIPRALPAAELKEAAAQAGLRGEAIADVNDAKRAAMALAGAHDFVFIGGSTYVVAELDEL